MKLINLVGMRFYRLTVESRSENTSSGHAAWNCKCDCGNTSVVEGSHLRRGNTKSCGCFDVEKLIARLTTHGMNGTPTHRTWLSMRQRCLNDKDQHYQDYGGRGIKICRRWYKFENFLEDMGERPKGKTIDRVDNDGGYSPDNCRWATPAENYKVRGEA